MYLLLIMIENITCLGHTGLLIIVWAPWPLSIVTIHYLKWGFKTWGVTNLIKIIKRTISENHKNWHNALFKALWDDTVTLKASIGNSRFFLIYGREVVLPPRVLLPSLQLSQKIQEEECPPLENQINVLLKLEEVSTQAKQKIDQHQKIVKSWFDTSSPSDRNFNVGYLVLK
jgi:hypothetical protein